MPMKSPGRSLNDRKRRKGTNGGAGAQDNNPQVAEDSLPLGTRGQ